MSKQDCTLAPAKRHQAPLQPSLLHADGSTILGLHSSVSKVQHTGGPKPSTTMVYDEDSFKLGPNQQLHDL